jgi:hypothetical protein
MTEKQIEEKANEIRKDEVARLLFCADVGITEDEFFVARNGDFEIEDMVRAFERGKQSRDCNCMTYLNFKDLEKENAELKERVKQQSDRITELTQELDDYINRFE